MYLLRTFKTIYFITLGVLVLTSCQQHEQEALVNPPLPEMDIKFSNYTLNAEEGGVITHPNGTTISIPSNALVDADGNPIKGEVDINYREFHDAVDVFFSGIPMDYYEPQETETSKADLFDFIGKDEVPKVEAKTFETAGMFDIRAEQNGKKVFLKDGKQANVKMASYVTGDDFQFFALNEKTKKWELVGKPEINENKEKKEKLAEIEAKKPEAFPYNSKTHFVFDYGAILDIQYGTIGKSQGGAERFANLKAKAYGLSHYGFRTRGLFKEVRFKGSTHLATLMVWKFANEGTTFPNWTKRKNDNEDIVVNDIVYLGNNRYQVNIQKQRLNTHTWDREVLRNSYIQLEPVMPLSWLLRKPVDTWQKSYDEALALVKVEEEEAQQLAEVYRSFDIGGFGIYNHDKFMNNKNRVQLMASFDFGVEVDQETIAANSIKVSLIGGDNRTIIEYPKYDWNNMKIVPNKGARMFAVLPGKKFVLMTAEEFAQIDFDKLRSLEKPKYKFKLKDTGIVVDDIHDIKTALGIKTPEIAM